MIFIKIICLFNNMRNINKNIWNNKLKTINNQVKFKLVYIQIINKKMHLPPIPINLKTQKIYNIVKKK